MRGSIASAVLCSELVLLAACGPHNPPPGPPPGEIPVGYGTQPREDVTGAVTSVDASKDENRNVHSVEELLRGRVPGLRVIHLPNGDISLRIRGTSSLRNDGEPLLIIDGMPIRPDNVSRALRGINPKEVDNIQVLKDVSSTAVYGIRGANGVIIITLKRD